MTPRSLQVYLARPAALAALMLALTACSGSATPRWDAQFGQNVRAVMAQQTRNPQAGQDGNNVDGIDGRAAQDALERYHKSFREPAPHTGGLTQPGVK